MNAAFISLWVLLITDDLEVRKNHILI